MKTITDDNRNQLSSFRISKKIIGLYQLKMAKDDKDGNLLLFGFDNKREKEERGLPSCYGDTYKNRIGCELSSLSSYHLNYLMPLYILKDDKTIASPFVARGQEDHNLNEVLRAEIYRPNGQVKYASDT